MRGLLKGLGVKVDRAVAAVGHAVLVNLVDVVCDLWYILSNPHQLGRLFAAQRLEVLKELVLIFLCVLPDDAQGQSAYWQICRLQSATQACMNTLTEACQAHAWAPSGQSWLRRAFVGGH